MYTIQLTEPDKAVLQAITDNSSAQLHYYIGTAQAEFDLRPGYQFEIETLSLKEPLEVAKTYHVTGSWLNYTKANPPVFTLAITAAQLITL
jgi:hypothetical protein